MEALTSRVTFRVTSRVIIAMAGARVREMVGMRATVAMTSRVIVSTWMAHLGTVSPEAGDADVRTDRQIHKHTVALATLPTQ